MRFIRLLFSMLFLFVVCEAQETFFSKVIIWGHPLHSHTHSYIHWAFYRAFKHLGYETYWVSSPKEIKDIDLTNALFITEGQVDQEMPKRQDCYYILHWCFRYCADEYLELFRNNRSIALHVYTHDCEQRGEKIDDYIYGNSKEKVIYMPWATDLLPHEIDDVKRKKVEKTSTVTWVGTIEKNFWPNYIEIEGFRKACAENNIIFNHYTKVAPEHNIDLIYTSYMAPAIQGPCQLDIGYIPCRIFKNISYGQWGITNNKTVYDLFKGKVIYNSDTYQLFYDAKVHIDTAPISELYELMDFVKTKHTYINRIETLLKFMKEALNIEEKA